MKKFVTFFGLIYSGFIFSQVQQTNCWTPAEESQIRVTGVRQIIPEKYRTFNLQVEEITSILKRALHEQIVKIDDSKCIITLPLPNGTIQQFRVVNSPIMAPELSAAYPEFMTFTIKGIDDPYANGKMDITEFGLHAMIFSTVGDFFVDPYCVGNSGAYISYFRNDFLKNAEHIIPEAKLLEEPLIEIKKEKNSEQIKMRDKKKASAICVGSQLKTYRLAIACTHQYAIAATGLSNPTLAQTLARVAITVNRVNGVYEKELSIRLVLVPTTTLVLYTSSATDSFTGNANNNANILIGQSQSIITASIGSANFDIGHTFSTGGGGLASVGCVCANSQKARGITGSANPVGDPYDIDYVAHEIGHQFGANHTFNAVTGNCNGNRDGSSAVEPGSGITIMGYAGICGINNLGANSIPFFHGQSYDEIIDYVTFANGSTCGAMSSTGNQAPIVNAIPSYTIPRFTPFILQGTATDPDGDFLTYLWEEMDVAATPGNWNSGATPYFRSYQPFTDNIRSFPRSSVVASGNFTNTIGEYLPNTSQTLNFRLTARDNRVGGGGVCYANTQVVIDTSGPLTIEYPTEPSIIWISEFQKTVLWNPRFTAQAPINCDSVRILISYNSGSSYSVLVNSTPNNGSRLIAVPTVTTTEYNSRIKIECIGNIFYDVSRNNFIVSNDPTVGIRTLSQHNPFSLNVWPNPNMGQFNFSAKNLTDGETEVSVINLLGQTQKKFSYYNRKEINETLDISELSNGVYFLKVNNSSNQSIYRLIKN